MPPEHRRASWRGLALVATSLAAAGWLAGPLAEIPLAASPAAQVTPAPSPRTSASPTPTTSRSPEEQIRELEARKLITETRMLDAQNDRLRQEQELDRQVWRAPAAAVASFGPTLVGLGLLYLLARALSRLLPPAPEKAEPADQLDEEDEEL